MVLRYGKTVEEADTRTMLSEPKQDYTRSLWAVRKLGMEARADTTPILTVRGVTASYGGAVTVRDLTRGPREYRNKPEEAEAALQRLASRSGNAKAAVGHRLRGPYDFFRWHDASPYDPAQIPAF